MKVNTNTRWVIAVIAAIAERGLPVAALLILLTGCQPTGQEYTPPVAPSTLSLDIPWCIDIKDADVRACVRTVKDDNTRWRLYQAQPLDGSGKRGEPTIVNVCSAAGTLPCLTLKDTGPRHAIRYVTVFYTADTTPFRDNKD